MQGMRHVAAMLRQTERAHDQQHGGGGKKGRRHGGIAQSLHRQDVALVAHDAVDPVPAGFGLDRLDRVMRIVVSRLPVQVEVICGNQCETQGETEQLALICG